MEALHAVLRPDGLLRLRTLIVSQFDADYWAGLQLLGAEAAPSRLARAVRIAYARLPDRAPDSFAAEVALFATVNGTGVRSLDLVNTWRKKTEIKVLPLHRGMLFKAVGRQWQVLWPPRELYSEQLAALNGAARDVEQLAETLAVAGDSTFKDNLEAARESALPSDAPEEGVGAWYEPDGVSPLPTLDDINNDIEEEEPAAVIRSHQRGSRTSGRSQGSIGRSLPASRGGSRGQITICR